MSGPHCHTPVENVGGGGRNGCRHGCCACGPRSVGSGQGGDLDAVSGCASKFRKNRAVLKLKIGNREPTTDTFREGVGGGQ